MTKNKLFGLLLSMLMLGNIAIADEIQANQVQDVQDNKAVFTFAKTPANSNTKQRQVVKNNWFCIIIINNGKIPFDKSESNN